MKSFLIVVSFIILFGIGIWLHLNDSNSTTTTQQTLEQVNKEETLSTEQFVIDYLLSEDGTIRTDIKPNTNSNIALSESIGLWMEYLAEKGDLPQFEEAYRTIKDQFLAKNNLLFWKIENGQAARSNALIDDLRVMEALFKVGERSNNQHYIHTAKSIANAVLNYNREGSFFVDFYEMELEEKGDILTLTYLNPSAFQYMVKYNVLSEYEMDELRKFMSEIPMENGFYPKSFRQSDDTFQFDSTVNLIDQLYVALHLERFDINTDQFFEWIHKTFYNENLLYGQYDQKTKKNAVQYESVAVYALVILYSIEKQEYSLAEDIYYRMIRLRNNNPDASYFGGFVTSDTTHSFDNLLALLAERKLVNEQVINP